jgi:hypothetical protein
LHHIHDGRSRLMGLLLFTLEHIRPSILCSPCVRWTVVS